ncbi:MULTISPECIES: DNA-3-methyladenine glycosylase [Hyphomicrobiales]|jgi:DNA-3-methyladenine glycosylase|uniref:DNA-3-methyladenine glycosylase n=1 Tax=Methylobacterium sp. CCH7-A2 TaxID=1768789 RepID=UPI000833E3A1|nr:MULTISPECIES: DNA-3-methyladenine glycosylase [Hyphomicrobiales]
MDDADDEPLTRAGRGPHGHAARLRREELDLTAWELARRLVGVALLCEDVGGIIVETEAYARDDAASHSFRGLTPRNRSMFAGPGRLAQALAIDIAHDGADATAAPFALLDRAVEPLVLTGRRIGISRERERPWRFALAGSSWLSRALMAAEPTPYAAPHETGEARS